MSGLFGGGKSSGAAEAQLAEQSESRRRARMRGGSRMLLSGARVNPEEGVTTLGSVGGGQS